MTVSAVAEHKGITLAGIKVRVSRKTKSEDEIRSSFFVEIELPRELDEREKVLLFNSARRCDVTKILAGEMDFSYKLIEN